MTEDQHSIGSSSKEIVPKNCKSSSIGSSSSKLKATPLQPRSEAQNQSRPKPLEQNVSRMPARLAMPYDIQQSSSKTKISIVKAPLMARSANRSQQVSAKLPKAPESHSVTGGTTSTSKFTLALSKPAKDENPMQHNNAMPSVSLVVDSEGLVLLSTL